jgi:hypothetical protein
MKRRPRIYYTESQKKLMWDHWYSRRELTIFDVRYWL